MQNELIDVLTDQGLTTPEAKIYLGCLKLKKATVQQIAEVTSIKRTSIYNFIDDLINSGYIIKDKIGKKDYFFACPPKSLLERAKYKLQACEELVPKLENLYAETVEPKITPLNGATQIMQIFEEELKCHKEVLYIWPGVTTYHAVKLPTKVAVLDSERAKRGIKVRSIRFKDTHFESKYMNYGKAYLKEVRYAPKEMSTKMGLAIYDTGKVGFFSSRAESFAVIINSAEMHALASIFFNLLWAKSKIVPY